MSEIAMGYTLTLADPGAESVVLGKSGSGQGELINALKETPLGRLTRSLYKRRDVDTSYLCRFDDTDYCQWFGRKSDGCFHPISHVMKIVRVAERQP